jgi:GAF domain-containing protein
VPIVVGDKVWGVLDIDSPVPARFSAEDQAGIERLCRVFTEASDLNANASIV